VFNQTVDNLKLPQSLTHLTFGCMFNKSIDNLKLPKSITHLTLSSRFDQSADYITSLPLLFPHLIVEFQ